MRHLNEEKLNTLLKSRLDENIEKKFVSGAQLAVLQDGKLLCKISAGRQRPEESTPIYEDAMYRMASMTKPVTAVAALIAEDLGYFDIEDLVSDYLPQFADMNIAKLEDGKVAIDRKNTVPLRIRHMLTHTSGMVAETKIGFLQNKEVPLEAYESQKTLVDYCSRLPLAFEPESYTAYSSRSAFDTVARIIEIKSGMAYKDFLKKYVFEPLEMKDTTFTPDKSQWARVTALTAKNDGGEFYSVDIGEHFFKNIPLSYTGAGSCLASTLEDYLKFAWLLQSGGELSGVRIFEEKRIHEMRLARVPHTTPGRDPISSWGLGVRVVDREGVLPVGSFGWSGAYGTHFWVDPENKITALYLRNSCFDAGGCGQIGREFEKDVMSCLE